MINDYTFGYAIIFVTFDFLSFQLSGFVTQYRLLLGYLSLERNLITLNPGVSESFYEDFVGGRVYVPCTRGARLWKELATLIRYFTKIPSFLKLGRTQEQ